MTVLDLDQFAAEHACSTNSELIYKLRQRYGSAQAIASLASTELRSADPDRLAYCDREMSWFFDDLGNCFYDCLSGVIQAMRNGPLLATAPTTGDLRGLWEGVPAIVLGAGPGASDQWEHIKRVRRSTVLLIVCDVMLKPCLERDIRPDYICAQERIPLVYDSLKGLDTTGITLIAPPVIEPRVVDLFQGRVIWCWRGCSLELWMDPAVPRNNFGRSCGTQGVGVACVARCSPIYLIGHDLCMQDGRTHAGGVHEMTEQTRKNIESDSDEYHRKMPARSISGREVVTTHLWSMFRADIEHIIAEHPHSEVVNIGDGIPIIGTRSGVLPTNPMQLGVPLPKRKSVGKNPAIMLPQMLDDIHWLKAACNYALTTSNTLKAEDLKLSEIVSDETATVWQEIYGGTYVCALIRLHLQPDQYQAMLKRVAQTIEKTLTTVENIIKEIMP